METYIQSIVIARLERKGWLCLQLNKPRWVALMCIKDGKVIFIDGMDADPDTVQRIRKAGFEIYLHDLESFNNWII